MAAKKSTDVMIAGKVYTLSGYEEEGYLQRVASYINAKISEITEREEFRRIPNDMKAILIELNIADDYFKARTRFEDIEENYKKAEKDLFDLKHELVDTQMKVEELLEKLESERQEKNNKNAREQALEEQYKKLEDKYQLLLSNAKIADEKNRQFEEILRLSQKEKRELESVNKELRMNKEKLESALADALFGASQQTEKDANPPEIEQPPIVELSEEEKQAIAELTKISEPLSEKLSEEDLAFTELSEAETMEIQAETEAAEFPETDEAAEEVEKTKVIALSKANEKKAADVPKKKDSQIAAKAASKENKNIDKIVKKNQISMESVEDKAENKDSRILELTEKEDTDLKAERSKDTDADVKDFSESTEEAGILPDLIQFSKEPDFNDSLDEMGRTGTEFSEEIEPVRTSFSKEEDKKTESNKQLTELLEDDEEELQETDDVFLEISEDDDPELKEIAKQIAEMNRQEKAEKRKKKAK